MSQDKVYPCSTWPTSSPFLLNATLKLHILKYELVSLYVDHIITGEGDNDRDCQLYVKLNRHLQEGRFNARKFSSNSHNLVCKIKEDERILERSYQGTLISTRENSKTVVEEE